MFRLVDDFFSDEGQPSIPSGPGLLGKKTGRR